jgi:hypothetical protein
LKLSEETWNFTGLDLANGVYPTLKYLLWNKKNKLINRIFLW